MSAWNRSLVVAAISACSLITGCGSHGDRPELAKVTGQVLLDGAPLDAAVVTFEPTNGRPSFGRTDSEGKYTLAYRTNVPGAAIGGHVVRISTNLMIEDPATGHSKMIPEKIPPQYNRDSMLTANVYEGDNEISFELKAGKK